MSPLSSVVTGGLRGLVQPRVSWEGPLPFNFWAPDFRGPHAAQTFSRSPVLWRFTPLATVPKVSAPSVQPSGRAPLPRTGPSAPRSPRPGPFPLLGRKLPLPGTLLPLQAPLCLPWSQGHPLSPESPNPGLGGSRRPGPSRPSRVLPFWISAWLGASFPGECRAGKRSGDDALQLFFLVITRLRQHLTPSAEHLLRRRALDNLHVAGAPGLREPSHSPPG